MLDVVEPDSADGPTVAVVGTEWTPGRALVEVLNETLAATVSGGQRPGLTGWRGRGRT